jgi:hypothetical protein
MKTRVIIHHTGFHRWNSKSTERDRNHSQRTIICEVSETARGAEIAEQAFYDTNAPMALLNEVSRSGDKCYSTSVGDFVQVEAPWNPLEIEIWLCTGGGWEPVEIVEFHALVGLQYKAFLDDENTRWSMDREGREALAQIRSALV